MSSSDGIATAFAFTGTVGFEAATAGFKVEASVFTTGLPAGKGFSYFALLDENLLVAIGIHLRWFRQLKLSSNWLIERIKIAHRAETA